MSRRLSRYLLASALLLVVTLLVRRTLGLREQERRVVPSVDPWPPIREAEAQAVTAAVVQAPAAAATVEAPAAAATVEAPPAAAATVEAPPAAAAVLEAAPASAVVEVSAIEAAPPAAVDEVAPPRPAVDVASPAAAPTPLSMPPPPVARTTPTAGVPSASQPSVVVDTAPDAAATWASPLADSCPDGYPIKAKVASGIYHLPGMANYSRTRPDRCYASEEAAVEDGFVKAKR